MVEAFTSLQDQLQRERRAMEKTSKEREKQIERVINNSVDRYGDTQGVIGGKMLSALLAGKRFFDALRKIIDRQFLNAVDAAPCTTLGYV